MKVKSVFGKKEYRALLEKVTGKSAEALFLAPEEVLEPQMQAQFLALVEKWEAGVPLAYLLGEQMFYGRAFFINEEVLIPRPETEGLLERALALPARRVLELCTGSGVLAVSMTLEGKSVTAVDISESALSVARENARVHDADVHFLQSDLFEHIEGTYELIVANPPYIDSEVLRTLDVSSQEPLVALDGGEKGMEIIWRILQEAPMYLEPGGVLLMEIGWDQATKVKEAASSYESVAIEKDLFGRDRYVLAQVGRE